MSNTLSFGIKIEGAPQAKAQLQEIAALQSKLNKGNMLSGINPATVARSPELLAELRRLTTAQSQGGAFPFGAFLNQSLGIGAGQNRPNRANYQAMFRSLVPPQLTPPVIPQGINFRQAALGVGASVFSPWVGARLLSGSGLFGSGGGGNGLGKLLGGGGGLVGFGAALIAITATTELLKKSFESLIGAIQEGAKLYQRAARLGTSSGKAFQLESLAKVLGLSPGELDTLFLRGSHPRSGRQAFFQQSDIKTLLGSGNGTNQLGALQQIKNMGDYATRTFRDLALSTDEMDKNAKSMQEIFYYGNLISIEFKSVMVQIATLLMPVFKKLAEDILTLLLAAQLYFKQYLDIFRALGVLPKAGTSNTRIGVGRTGGSTSLAGPWERMGFVIGGFAQQDYARKTAENTAEIVKNTKGMADAMRGMFPGGGKGVGAGASGLGASYNFFHALP